MNNLGALIKQAQEMQARMAEMQEKLASIEVTGASGGGMVRATVTAKGAVRQVKIDPSLVNPAEIEVLEDLIVAALNEARTKADALASEEMQKLTGGLDLPAGLKLPF
jgi:DNA-binding YbaB/EbfC family protein